MDPQLSFQRVTEVFQGALDQPAGSPREAWLEARCAGDTETLAEVRSLLAALEDESAANRLALSHENSPHRFGPYETIRLLGRGGMGAVFLARRVDGQFEHAVAVKTVHAALAGDLFDARFRAERQILASLNHPNITRLLDGGVSPDGQPYLVMEYVDGAPLDRHCDERQLGIEARIRLFLDICSAISYAHRNLVVHRDLKPSNIMVDASSVPHLLDFGTAKLLNDGADLTRSALLPMTPRYASPEQLRSRAATPAADQFSLGVILFELLTGAWPFGDSETPVNVLERVVRDTSPRALPACVTELAARNRATSEKRLKQMLEGDLSTIVRKTLEQDPERRYATVDELSSDLRRYLEGRPVLARPQTVAYRAGKFVRRHWVATAATAIALGAIGAGVVGTIQAKRVAERRFQDVRSIAGYMLTDLDDQVAMLPGSTPVRASMSERSMKYLDALRAQAGSDVALRLELAQGYRRLGNVLGNLFRSNLGKPAEARAAYTAGAEIAEQLVRERPSDAEARHVLASLQMDRALMESLASTGTADLDNVRRSIETLETLSRADTESASQHFDLGRAYMYFAQIHQQRGGIVLTSNANAGDMARAETHLKRAVELNPNVIEYRMTLADYYERIAIAKGTIDPSAAMLWHDRALKVFETLPAKDRKAFTMRHWEARLHLNQAWSLGQLQQYDEAIKLLSAVQVVMEQLAAVDSENARLQYDLTGLYRTWGIIAGYAGRKREAIEHFTSAVRIYDAMRELTDPLRFLRIELLMRIAQLHADLGERDVAAARAREAAASARILADRPEASGSSLVLAAELLSDENFKGVSDPEAAIRYAERAASKLPDDVKTTEILAQCYYVAGRRKEAVETLERALALSPVKAGEPVSRSRAGLLQKLEQYRK